MNKLLKNIEKRWQAEEVKYKYIGKEIKWRKTLRTADCAICKEHIIEEKEDQGFINWALLFNERDQTGRVPEICPECTKKIHGDIIPAPRFAECRKCKVRQREKIYGVGWPGWKLAVDDGRMPRPEEIVRKLICPNCTIELAKLLGEKFVRGSWTDLTYAAGSLLTSTKMTQNQANIEEASRHDKQALTVVWASTSTIDVDATLLCMDELSEPLTSVNLTIDITAGGANGLDGGAEGANTWYSIWVIFKPTTNTIAGLLSESATAPTMPADYTKKRRVGWVRNDNGSDFLKFYQIGNWWWWDIHYNVLTTVNAATTWTDIACSSYIPSTSNLMIVSVYSADTNGEGTDTFLRRNGASESGTHNFYHRIHSSGATSIYFQVMTVMLSSDDSQIIEYKNSSGDEHCTINVKSYYDPI